MRNRGQLRAHRGCIVTPVVFPSVSAQALSLMSAGGLGWEMTASMPRGRTWPTLAVVPLAPAASLAVNASGEAHEGRAAVPEGARHLEANGTRVEL
jgi:hypothetical protein